MAVLRVERLQKTFTSGRWPFGKRQTFTAVNNISFDLKKGEILGLLGPNGAGKTTTIQMLLGLLTPTAGTITYFGKNFAQERSTILSQVTSASSYGRLPARLTVWENLDIFGRLYNMPHAQRLERIEYFLKFFAMWDMRTKSTGMLSAGQATRVMLAKAFLPQPKIVLLDEPTAALDPDVAHEVRQFILNQQQEHDISVLFTSHNMAEVTEVCDRVLVLRKGSIIADNTPEQLAATVSSARLNLILSDGLDRLIALLTEKNIKYTLQEHSISVDIDEQAIAQFLIELAEHRIVYSQISIDKPTLEDYFLSIAKA